MAASIFPTALNAAARGASAPRGAGRGSLASERGCALKMTGGWREVVVTSVSLLISLDDLFILSLYLNIV